MSSCDILFSSSIDEDGHPQQVRGPDIMWPHKKTLLLLQIKKRYIVSPELACPISFIILYDIGQDSSGVTILPRNKLVDEFVAIHLRFLVKYNMYLI